MKYQVYLLIKYLIFFCCFSIRSAIISLFAEGVLRTSCLIFSPEFLNKIQHWWVRGKNKGVCPCSWIGRRTSSVLRIAALFIFFSPNLFSNTAIFSIRNSKQWLELIPCDKSLLVPTIFCFLSPVWFWNLLKKCNQSMNRQPRMFKLVVPFDWTSTSVGVPYLEQATGCTIFFLNLLSSMKIHFILISMPLSPR